MASRSTPQIAALAVGATVLAACAVAWPMLGMPAFLVVVLAAIVAEGRWRWLVGLVGGTLALVGFTRFLLLDATPNIVIAGRIAIEEKAVDQLREVRWAEQQASKSGGYRTLADLRGHFLDSGIYRPTSDPRAYRSDSYLLTVYLPAAGGGWTTAPGQVDPAKAHDSFVAYAWPGGDKYGGQRVFFIDQDDRICESTAGPFVGPSHPPPPTAASVGGPPCGDGWKPWRNKKPQM